MRGSEVEGPVAAADATLLQMNQEESAALAGAPPEVVELEPPVKVGDRPDTDDPAGAPAPGTVRAPRDAIPRVLDRAAGDAAEDWTSFDVNSNMRAPRFGSEAQTRRELRKLYIR